MATRRWVALLLAGALVGAGCGSDDTQPVLVFAASSLTDAFTAMAEAFEQATPGVDVDLSFAGSSTLREQVLAGAPADVIATANSTIMVELSQAAAIEDFDVLTTNRLALVVPVGNPGDVVGLDDLDRDELLVGLCAAQVPCGQFADWVLDEVGVVAAVDTREPDVRALLTKVELGELDAGLVYGSDVVAADGGVEEVPTAIDGVTIVPIAVLADAPRPADARAFVDFALSDDGQEILASFGFGGRP